jgi:UDP-3-O-[3-hydroxymyristoyl] glucosamine N-acyltransferase
MDYPDTIVIAGAGGGGEITYWSLIETYPGVKVVFVDDNPAIDEVDLVNEIVPVFHSWDLSELRKIHGPDSFRQFLPSSTYPKVKKLLAEKAMEAGLEPAPAVVHPKASVLGRPSVTLGRGVLLHHECFVCNRTVIRDFVHVFPSAVIGHHCEIGAYSALNATSVVNGYSTLGEGVLVGAGCVMRDHISIAPWVTIGVQTAIVKDITEPGITVVGVPAHPMSGEH